MHVEWHHRLIEEAACHKASLGSDLGWREHEGGDRVDHGHRHQPEEAGDEAEDDVQALAVGELVPHVVPGVDDDDLTQEHEGLDQKYPEEHVLQDGEEDGEERDQGEHERDRERCARGEQQDNEARQVSREALVVVLLGHHTEVLAGGRYEDGPDNEGRKEDVRLDQNGDNDVLADYRYVKVAYGHPLLLLARWEVHDPADGQKHVEDHDNDHEDAYDRGEWPAYGVVVLRAPLEPGDGEEESDEDRRHHDGPEGYQRVSWEEHEHLLVEEEEPLGPRHVGNRRRVGWLGERRWGCV